MQKKSKLIIFIIISLFVLVLASYIFLKYGIKSIDKKEEIYENIYMAGDLEVDYSRFMSVWKNSEIQELTYSYGGYISYFPKIQAYLLKKPVFEGFELVLINTKNEIKSLDTYKMSSLNIAIINDYIIIPIEKNKYKIINSNNLLIYNIELGNKTGDIVTIINDNIFFKDSNNFFVLYNLNNNMRTVISENKTKDVITKYKENKVFFKMQDNQIVCFDMEKEEFIKDIENDNIMIDTEILEKKLEKPLNNKKHNFKNDEKTFGYIIQNEDLVFVQINTNKDNLNQSRESLYNIYINDKEIYNGAIYCSIAQNNILYKTSNGEFFIVENGKNKKLNIDTKNYAYIVNKEDDICINIKNENCKFNLAYIEGYWKKTNKNEEYFCEFNKYGQKIIPVNILKNKMNFQSLDVKESTIDSMVWGSINNKIKMINDNMFINQNEETWKRISKKEFDENIINYINENTPREIADNYFGNNRSYLEKIIINDDSKYYLYRNDTFKVLISEYGECYSYNSFVNKNLLEREVGWEYTSKSLKAKLNN
ncbi:MAG: hypothetical protein ACRC57_03025 [Sarcina sp.]